MAARDGRVTGSPVVAPPADAESLPDHGPGRAAAGTPEDVTQTFRSRLRGYALVCLELALVLIVVSRYEVAARIHFFPILCLAVGGFLIHYWLPPRLKAPFFGLLSAGGILFYLGWPDGAYVIGLGCGLIALCYLPVPFALRVALVGIAG